MQCDWFLQAVRYADVDPQCLSLMMSLFSCLERRILRTIGIQVRKIHDLFTLFVTKIMVFGVR